MLEVWLMESGDVPTFCQIWHVQYTQQIKFTTAMIPENLPVFHIDLDCEFESSDNVFPSYPKNDQSPKSLADLTTLSQSETSTIFTSIGHRKDNLDRCLVLTRQNFTIFSLFDGHCDPQPVDYLAAELAPRLARHPNLLTHPETAFLQVFEDCERQVIEKFDKGSTALIVVLTQNELIVGNLGDCKLMGVDSQGHLKDYTKSHNLNNSQELKAVIQRGGIVLKRGSQYRINGQLNLSRCFGDRHLKNFVSSQPDIYRFNRNECKRWILASDGFYNAENLQERCKVSNFNDLLSNKTVYKDNASAIFFDS